MTQEHMKKEHGKKNQFWENVHKKELPDLQPKLFSVSPNPWLKEWMCRTVVKQQSNINSKN